MTDLQTLHDAFSELERRADVASAFPRPVKRRQGLALRLVPVAVAVVAVVTGAVWLAPGPPTGGDPAAAAPLPTPEELTDTFRAVLGENGKLVVTESWGDKGEVGIAGTVSAERASPGKRGDQVQAVYDLRLAPVKPGAEAGCENPKNPCVRYQDQDGSTVAVEFVESKDGTATGVFVRHTPDGAGITLRVEPHHGPVDIKAITWIILSDRW